jgi:hypothetical protein
MAYILEADKEEKIKENFLRTTSTQLDVSFSHWF